MRTRVNLLDFPTNDHVNLEPLSAYSNVTVRTGTAQMWRVKLTANLAGITGISGQHERVLWDEPATPYCLTSAIVEFTTNIVIASGTGAIDVFLTVANTVIINSAAAGTSGGTLSAGTYNIAGSNKRIWTMGHDTDLAAGSGGSVSGTHPNVYYSASKLYVFAGGVSGVTDLVIGQGNTGSTSITSGTVNVYLAGFFTH